MAKRTHSMSHSFDDDKRLLRCIARLQSEIARLREDNLQLRCALSIYSEAARRSVVDASQG